jgi:acid phosphatase family membrane protein YuiD
MSLTVMLRYVKRQWNDVVAKLTGRFTRSKRSMIIHINPVRQTGGLPRSHSSSEE